MGILWTVAIKLRLSIYVEIKNHHDEIRITEFNINDKYYSSTAYEILHKLVSWSTLIVLAYLFAH